MIPGKGENAKLRGGIGDESSERGESVIGHRFQIKDFQVPDCDLRNVVRLECGVCGAELMCCYHVEYAVIQTCLSCGSKFKIVWTPKEVKMTCMEVAEL